MNHYQQIHRAAYDALCELAAGWPPEAVGEAIAAGCRRAKLMAVPANDFRFDNSRHGAAARVAQVLDRMRTAEAVFDPEAQP